MSAGLFTEWFYDFFVPKVEQCLDNKKAILMIDNSCSHTSNLKTGEIEVTFFPPNVTSLVQPMDHFVLECFKRNYR